ncbi:MAG: hypothetical protein LBI05_04605, partial [Planctomycetaceae bacterium]|nr:hypothetical protein [Planctomycetaceae bacterium]
KAGLTGHQWIGGRLEVPISKHNDYVIALKESNVVAPTGRERLNAAKNLTAWDSSKIMDKRMIAAAEVDCAEQIKRIRGIADASVHSNKRPAWERNVWVRTQITSVGVFVEAIDNKPLPPETIATIGQVIKPAFGITDMKEVSIVDEKHGLSYDGTGEEQGTAQSVYLRHQTRYQDDLNNRIRLLLPAVAGLKVDTMVKLSTHRDMKAFEVEHKKPTALTVHELDYHLKKEGYDRFFRPGQIAQWSAPLIDPTGNISPKDFVDEKKREAEVTNALPGTEKNWEELPFIPLQISATIRIPRDYLLTLWREQNRVFGGDPDVKPDPDELKSELSRIQAELTLDTKKSIGKLLEPYRASNKIDPLELVEVVYYDLPRPEEVILTAWEKFLLFMKENWKNLSLMSLVFSGMFVLYLISKPPKDPNVVIYEGLETPLEAIDARIAEKRRLEEEARRLAEEEAARVAQEEFENSLGELGSLRSLRDEIAELIAKNPEAAAAVIRQWIGNAVLVESNT